MCIRLDGFQADRGYSMNWNIWIQEMSTNATEVNKEMELKYVLSETTNSAQYKNVPC